MTDAERTELGAATTRLQAIEPELRAALVVEAADGHANGEADGEANGSAIDAEQRERLELRAKASLTAYFAAAMSGRQVGGAEAEYAAAEGVNAIPIALLDPDPRQQPERRADAPTAAPGTVGVNLQPIRPAVFASSILPRLGVEMPRVMSGTYAEARISTSLTAAAKGKGDAADSTAAVFAIGTATPKRVSARLSIRAEDIAAVGQAQVRGEPAPKPAAGAWRRARQARAERRRHRRQPYRVDPAPGRPCRPYGSGELRWVRSHAVGAG